MRALGASADKIAVPEAAARSQPGRAVSSPPELRACAAAVLACAVWRGTEARASALAAGCASRQGCRTSSWPTCPAPLALLSGPPARMLTSTPLCHAASDGTQPCPVDPASGAQCGSSAPRPGVESVPIRPLLALHRPRAGSPHSGSGCTDIVACCRLLGDAATSKLWASAPTADSFEQPGPAALATSARRCAELECLLLTWLSMLTGVNACSLASAVATCSATTRRGLLADLSW